MNSKKSGIPQITRMKQWKAFFEYIYIYIYVFSQNIILRGFDPEINKFGK